MDKINSGSSRPRRSLSLASLLRQARKAGAVVSGATVEDGKVTLTFGEPTSPENVNEWDEALRRESH